MNSTLPQRQAVSLPITKDPFGDDPFSGLQSNQSPSSSLFGSRPVSSGSPAFSLHLSGESERGSGNPFGPAPTPARVEKNEGFNTNRASLNNSPDPFIGLCSLGKKEPIEKPVKDMFTDLQPRKTLNQLRTDSPMTVNAQQQQASGDPFSTPQPQHNFPSNNHCLADPQNANNRPNMIPVDSDPWSVFDETVPALRKSMKARSPGTFGVSSSDFNLPSPDMPPPPLPSHIELVSSVPAPPPRPTASTSSPSPAPLYKESPSCSPSKNRVDRTVQIISVPRPSRNKVTNMDGISQSWTHCNNSPVQDTYNRPSEVRIPLHITTASKPPSSSSGTFAPAELSILNNRSLQETQINKPVSAAFMSLYLSIF